MSEDDAVQGGGEGGGRDGLRDEEGGTSRGRIGGWRIRAEGGSVGRDGDGYDEAGRSPRAIHEPFPVRRWNVEGSSPQRLRPLVLAGTCRHLERDLASGDQEMESSTRKNKSLSFVLVLGLKTLITYQLNIITLKFHLFPINIGRVWHI